MRWIIALTLSVITGLFPAAHAAYGEVQLGASGVQNSELDFYPIFGSVSIGAFLTKGIGIEAFYDSNIASDRDGGFDLEIEEAYGLAARFQSQPRRGTSGFVVLGVVNYTVDQSSVGTASLGATEINETFTGARVSLGLVRQFDSQPHIKMTVEYRHYNADEPIRMDALLLGLRVNLQ